MWVYSGNTWSARLELERPEGYGLDYWLFLHAEETHGVWRSRPLGLSGLAEMAQNLNPKVDRVRTGAIARELEAYAPLAFYLDDALPQSRTTRCVPKGKREQCELDGEWREWLERQATPDAQRRFATRLCEALTASLDRGDLFEAAFLTRRFSSELAELYASPRTLFAGVASAYAREARQPLADCLGGLLDPPQPGGFLVTFPVAPVAISGKVATATLGPPEVSLLIEANPEAETAPAYLGSRSLRAIRVRTAAPTANEALARALPECRNALHLLRVRHYLRTHLYGPVRVVAAQAGDADEAGDADGATSGAEGILLSLDQPFWTPKQGRRPVPELPPRLYKLAQNLPPDQHDRWAALRWHVSQAIGYWPEDVHSAASEVWQALESFAGSAAKVNAVLVPEYRTLLLEELLAFEATKLRQQAYSHRKLFDRPGDWYYCEPKRVPPRKWLARVLDRRSRTHWSTWQDPRAPDLLFNPGVGLLSSLERLRAATAGDDWLTRRLRLAMDHLYGIRNSTVHKGERVGSDQWAAHVARCGLELVLSVANARAAPLLEEIDARDAESASIMPSAAMQAASA